MSVPTAKTRIHWRWLLVHCNLGQAIITESLKINPFKKSLVILSEQWMQNSLSAIINNKKILVTVDEKCYSYIVDNSTVKGVEELHCQCFDEERDTWTIFHISKWSTIYILNLVFQNILLNDPFTCVRTSFWLPSS